MWLSYTSKHIYTIVLALRKCYIASYLGGYCPLYLEGCLQHSVINQDLRRWPLSYSQEPLRLIFTDWSHRVPLFMDLLGKKSYRHERLWIYKMFHTISL
jgi:hypothetical protein